VAAVPITRLRQLRCFENAGARSQGLASATRAKKVHFARQLAKSGYLTALPAEELLAAEVAQTRKQLERRTT